MRWKLIRLIILYTLDYWIWLFHTWLFEALSRCIWTLSLCLLAFSLWWLSRVVSDGSWLFARLSCTRCQSLQMDVMVLLPFCAPSFTFTFVFTFHI